MSGISVGMAIVALAVFVFFWAGVLMALGLGKGLTVFGPRPKKARVYPNMKNCTFNNVWIDGNGVEHRVSILHRLALWCKFNNPLSRTRRMIRASGIRAREFKYGPVGGNASPMGRDLYGIRTTDWGPLPADPTISSATLPGDQYFNTVTEKVRVLNTAKTAWIDVTSSGGSTTFAVAAVNALHPERADYQCDGVDDQITINQAIADLPAGGGKIVFSEGTFNMNVSSIPPAYYSVWVNKSNITFQGAGAGATIFLLGAAQSCNVFQVNDGISNVHFYDLQVDGSNATNPEIHALLQCGIRFSTPAGAPLIYNCSVQNCYIKNCASLGIYLVGRYVNAITNVVQDCGRQYIEIVTGPGQIIGNTCVGRDGTVGYGPGEDAAAYAVIADNVIYNEAAGAISRGLSMAGGLGCIFENNIVWNVAQSINAAAGTRNQILNNRFDESGPGLLDGIDGDFSGNLFYGGGVTINGSASRLLTVKNNAFYATTNFIVAGTVANVYAEGNVVNVLTTVTGIANGPRPTQSIQCFLARATNNVLAASGNGNYSALAQPDANSGRNLVAQCINGGGGGIGTVTVTGTDQFGNAVSEAHIFAGAATFDMAKIFATINVNGIVLSGLAGGDTISVGYGNKLGADHRLFVGAMKKVFKSGVGDITATATEDAVYHAVTMPANIAANDTYNITSLDCLA